uniref:Uncharacterized protein n=1 Tax=Malurus cyaneus samueli TaxID=2593467 RepID=A0A8C5UCX6_9PASS
MPLKPFTYPLPETRFLHAGRHVYKFKIRYGNFIRYVCSSQEASLQFVDFLHASFLQYLINMINDIFIELQLLLTPWSPISANSLVSLSCVNFMLWWKRVTFCRQYFEIL